MYLDPYNGKRYLSRCHRSLCHPGIHKAHQRLFQLWIGIHFTFLSITQFHTLHVPSLARDVAHRVLASMISYYPGRGEGGSDEAMRDAGGIAMSRDTGPWQGYRYVLGWGQQNVLGS